MKLNEILLNEVRVSDVAQLMKLPQSAGFSDFMALIEDLGYRRIGTEGSYGDAYALSKSATHIIKILHSPDECYMQFATRARQLMKNPHVPKFLWIREFNEGKFNRRHDSRFPASTTWKYSSGVFVIERLVALDDVRPELVAAKYKTDLDLATLEAVKWDVDWMDDNGEWIEEVEDLAYRNVTKDRDVDMKEIRKIKVPLWNQALSLVDLNGCLPDLHNDNVMLRYKTMEFVIIDPAFNPY